MSPRAPEMSDRLYDYVIELLSFIVIDKSQSIMSKP